MSHLYAILVRLVGYTILISPHFCRAQPFQTPSLPDKALPEKVILDTDIGDDIDDAFAVALALRSPELQILGITTTFGDTETRAKLLDRFLAELARPAIPRPPTPPSPSNST